MAKPLRRMAKAVTNEQAAQALTRRGGFNQSLIVKGSNMADETTIPILPGKSTENNASTWKPVGPLAAALVKAAQLRAGK